MSQFSIHMYFSVLFFSVSLICFLSDLYLPLLQQNVVPYNVRPLNYQNSPLISKWPIYFLSTPLQPWPISFPNLITEYLNVLFLCIVQYLVSEYSTLGYTSNQIWGFSIKAHRNGGDISNYLFWKGNLFGIFYTKRILIKLSFVLVCIGKNLYFSIIAKNVLQKTLITYFPQSYNLELAPTGNLKMTHILTWSFGRDGGDCHKIPQCLG